MSLLRRRALMMASKKEMYDFNYFWDKFDEAYRNGEIATRVSLESQGVKYLFLFGALQGYRVLNLDRGKTYKITAAGESARINLCYIDAQSSQINFQIGILNPISNLYDIEQNFSNADAIEIKWNTGAYNFYNLQVEEV